MNCISCTRWNLRDSGQMAHYGFAICDLGKKHEYKSSEYLCGRFKELDPEKAKARVSWLDKQKG